jgi:hypothetical protein
MGALREWFVRLRFPGHEHTPSSGASRRRGARQGVRRDGEFHIGYTLYDTLCRWLDKPSV